MLAVLFNLGDQRFAIDVSGIEMVVPAMPLSPVPGAPAFVAGRFQCRGQIVPVIDLGRLIVEKALRRSLSTRYILVNESCPDGRTVWLGLFAESITETVEIPDELLTGGGLTLKDRKYLGRVFTADNGEIIQCVEPSDLLSREVRELLFDDSATTAAP